MTNVVLPSDERIRKVGFLGRLLKRPELGAVAGTVLVILFFALTAGSSGLFSAKGVINFMEVSAQLGIIAASAALLMIAGEFDLSIGSMIGFAGLVIAIPAVQWGWPLWTSILFAFAVALLVGYLNGITVVKTRLPSFIVTLGSLFMLRGLTLGLCRLITGRTQVSGVHEVAVNDWLSPWFAGQFGQSLMIWLADAGILATRPDGLPSVQGIPVSILWWLGLTLVFTWVLLRTCCRPARPTRCAARRRSSRPSLPSSLAARCSRAATARLSAQCSAPSSSASCRWASSTPASIPTG